MVDVSLADQYRASKRGLWKATATLLVGTLLGAGFWMRVGREVVDPVPTGIKPHHQLVAVSFESESPLRARLRPKMLIPPAQLGSLANTEAKRATDPQVAALWDRLLPRVEVGDSIATSTLLHLVQACNSFGFAEMHPTPSIVVTDPGLKDAQDQARERMLSRCSDSRTHEPEVLELLHASQSTLTELGDELATVEQVAMYDWDDPLEVQETRLWELAANASAAESKGAALRVLIVRGMASEFEGELTDSENPDRSPIIEYRSAAVAVLSCEVAGDCGPYTSFQERRCIDYGECASNLDIRAYVASVAFSDAERLMLQRYVDSLSDQLAEHRGGKG